VACAALRRAVRALCPPVPGLKDAERQRLGGLIFYGASHFVDRVSQILRERPSLSPDPVRLHAEALAGRQRRAACWAMVHGVLQQLSELANDCYLYEQGSAVEEAQQVMASYDLALAQGLLTGEAGRLVEDGLQISRVRVLLQRVEKRQRQARRRGERKLREARARVPGWGGAPGEEGRGGEEAPRARAGAAGGPAGVGARPGAVINRWG
jgi:hypothetical protein